MADDPPGKGITGQPPRGPGDSEAAIPPSPPRYPTSHATQPMVSQPSQHRIEALEDRIHAAEKWMIWLTGAIAFFGLCSVIVGILQWRVIRGQLEEMKSAGVDTHNLTVATGNLADAAIQADRPWLAPFESKTGNPASNIQINQPVREQGESIVWNSIDVWISNGGKSPAYIEVAQVGFHFYGQFPNRPEFVCPLNSGPQIRNLIPDAHTGFSCVQKGAIVPSRDLYAFANVEYRDIRTDKRYYAHFCKRYNPATKGFDLCSEYNDSN